MPTAQVARINPAAATGCASGLAATEVVVASRRYGNHLGVEVGARYVSSAVMGDGAEPPDVEDSYAEYAPSATPGCRAPHVWLGSANTPMSTLDLFGAGFTLLAVGPLDAWRSAARSAADLLSIPVACYGVGAPGLLDDGRVSLAYGLGDGDAVLIRPDGYVAWRSHGDPPSVDQLADVLRGILAR